MYRRVCYWVDDIRAASWFVRLLVGRAFALPIHHTSYIREFRKRLSFLVCVTSALLAYLFVMELMVSGKTSHDT